MEKTFYIPFEYHQHLMSQSEPSLAFGDQQDVTSWQHELRNKLREILVVPDAWDHQITSHIDPDPDADETETFSCEKIEFHSEPYSDVPGYLLKPKDQAPPFPVMICLQGHSPGMHISIGRAKTEKEAESIKGGRDIAIQAVRNGWAALVIEQRAFGVRKGSGCLDAALHALMLGKTLTGERVFDVMRAIDFIATQPDLDVKRVGCMGNSSGGTVSFYAACVDERIRLAVVSCSFCTYADSWMKYPHCACGYLPGIMKYADMGDLAGLVAPRHLIIVAGKKDSIAGFSGVQSAFSQAEKIFQAAGYPENISLIAADGGHQFYPDLAWPVITKIKENWE